MTTQNTSGTKYLTRKSYKSTARDKPKHSEKIDRTQPRRQGNGKGNIGRPGSELDPVGLDKNDPGYDSVEEEERIMATRKNTSKKAKNSRTVFVESRAEFHPQPAQMQKFISTIEDYTAFKTTVREATREYVGSHDVTEFIAASHMNDPATTVFHQDAPCIILKYSFDMNEDERLVVNGLLLHLYKQKIITHDHIRQSISHLYECMDDLRLDIPKIVPYVRECTRFLNAAGLLSNDDIECCEGIKFPTYEKSGDATISMETKEELFFNEFQEVKAHISKFVEEFLISGCGDELITCTQETISKYHDKFPRIASEIVKILVRASFDRTDNEREFVSRALADQVTSTIPRLSIERAFSELLGRVEDVYLDVPQVLQFLSSFMARAVADDVLTPSFLARADLLNRDMGAQVLQHVQRMVTAEHAYEKLAHVWVDDILNDDDDE